MSADDSAFPPVLDAWYLSGATAAGKSRVGMELARRLNAEIISLDSMALYRGMDIGTAKPSPAERREIPHHLLDCFDPTENCSLAQYLEMAHAAVEEIRSRHRTPLLVGGTPLYLKAMLRGLFQGPPADWEFRRQVREEVEQTGVEALHQRLSLIDPLSAAKLHPHDTRRIIRALEVFKITGRPLSHLQTQFEEGRSPREVRVFVLSWPRETLHERINRRVDQMFAAGWVEEVRALLDRYGQLGRTASQAVGYQEIIEHLHGRCDLATTIERVKARTRQFARRQETWFRGLSECRRLAMRADDSPETVAERILKEAPEFD